MSKLSDNPITKPLMQVQNRIHAALAQCGRGPEAVQLLAVSKKKPASALRNAYACGQRAFGENYLQEALEKQIELQDLDIEWHFIGPIQSNKTRSIAENFDWVHSVDREKVARRLSQQRPTDLPPLNLCIQINLDDEASKSGISLKELPAMLESLTQLPNICVRGLMAIPAKRGDFSAQQAALQPLAKALEEQRVHYPQLDALSMGMSADLEAAISAGATYVRIGTDIFGTRD
jgi:pyridoxal phosphate enzyme (YggS family)